MYHTLSGLRATRVCGLSGLKLDTRSLHGGSQRIQQRLVSPGIKSYMFLGENTYYVNGIVAMQGRTGVATGGSRPAARRVVTSAAAGVDADNARR